MADLDRLDERQRLAATHASIASSHLPEIVKLRREIFAGCDVAQVIVVTIRACDHILPPFECAVRYQPHAFHTYGTERTCVRTQPLAHLFGTRRTNVARAHGAPKLGFTQLMIAAQKRDYWLAIRHHDQALHLRGLRQFCQLCNVRDRLAAGCVKFFGSEITRGIGNGRSDCFRNRLLQIRRIPAFLAQRHEIFAGV